MAKYVQKGVGPSRDEGAGLKPRGSAESTSDTTGGRDMGHGVIKRNIRGTRPFGGDLKAKSKY